MPIKASDRLIHKQAEGCRLKWDLCKANPIHLLSCHRKEMGLTKLMRPRVIWGKVLFWTQASKIEFPRIKMVRKNYVGSKRSMHCGRIAWQQQHLVSNLKYLKQLKKVYERNNIYLQHLAHLLFCVESVMMTFVKGKNKDTGAPQEWNI